MLELNKFQSCFGAHFQRWSRGHKARGQGQGHKKNLRPRPRTAFPRTDTLEAKDRNARSQGQGPRTQAQVLSKKKKKVFTKIFQAIFTKRRFPKKLFQALHKILRIQKIVLSSSRGQAILRLRGQGLDLRGQSQALQNVSSRPRMCLRTPPLLISIKR